MGGGAGSGNAGVELPGQRVLTQNTRRRCGATALGGAWHGEFCRRVEHGSGGRRAGELCHRHLSLDARQRRQRGGRRAGQFAAYGVLRFGNGSRGYTWACPIAGLARAIGPANRWIRVHPTGAQPHRRRVYLGHAPPRPACDAGGAVGRSLGCAAPPFLRSGHE